MHGKVGLDRFRKAQTLEPFSVTANSTTKSAAQPALREPAHPTTVSINQAHGSYPPNLNHQNTVKKALTTDVAPAIVPTQQVTQVGVGQSTWLPPDWAIEPRPGVYYLEVLKDGRFLIGLIWIRGGIYSGDSSLLVILCLIISLSHVNMQLLFHIKMAGSAHGTFVANERLTKDCPVELEVGQSLRFAASTRTYVLRKNNAALFPPPPEPTEIDLPLPPDPSDEEAVLAYNTYINRALNGLRTPNKLSKSVESSGAPVMKDDNQPSERASKRIRRTRVAFKDQVGEELVEIVGFSDGADVETEPGPMGVKEGSLVGKYESLVQITVIPKGKEQNPVKQATVSQTGVTEKLKQVLNKVKAPTKSGEMYDDLYGEAFSVKVGSSWAYGSGGREASPSKSGGNTPGTESEKSESKLANNDNDDDLFG
ncbi:UNVERIFIED_CONTAM: protein phosphatase 1 regulatory inhibitor subunit PPP1R8 [Sesamum latifolium]|uniref:Protein phosphatase 1 regulatory inhibitor subunit PPP1R8 n=1 Tax=Sesamum latifolium TaxID=2727402 RepID=A0AAW2WQ01_9LAMI